MPELPEVETVKRGLDKRIIGKTVADVHFDWPKSFPNTAEDVAQFLVGSVIQRIRRRGKALIILLSSNYALVVHLKMTGQLVFVSAKSSDRFGAGHPNDSLVSALPDASTRVTIRFSDESKLYFNDQRKFGWMRLMPASIVDDLPFFQALGPEPLDGGLTASDFQKRFARRQNSTIKAALLNQATIAGIGNIYADEALWGAKIHPRNRVHTLTKNDLNTLFIEIQSILQKAIESGGSTDRNYVSADGKRGSYLQIARVFRREGQPCVRCGSIIEKIRVAGRGTHVCSICQKEQL